MNKNRSIKLLSSQRWLDFCLLTDFPKTKYCSIDSRVKTVTYSFGSMPTWRRERVLFKWMTYSVTYQALGILVKGISLLSSVLRLSSSCSSRLLKPLSSQCSRMLKFRPGSTEKFSKIDLSSCTKTNWLIMNLARYKIKKRYLKNKKKILRM